ncbi:GNAT family N-acetyltransferase [Allomuricauda taeanensis]|uniref:GNAT family N-acetyltransferase n=1 Tax=Flagellimonas taeanensis TaxID=1005926 RepID=UPI002E7BC699|nr:GNAT family N-acetyltransferase [Allomuricauda taeanensis]MEE1963902.1 GNAT family N-acetyltransferase [Allomuricauda taeanensis]
MKTLPKSNYKKAAEAIKNVAINTLFAEAVIEQKINGKIYVDNIEKPKTFYIIHPYGMTLLLGDSENNEFNNPFKDYALNIDNTRRKPEWMQAYPPTWDSVLSELFGDRLIASSENKEQNLSGIIELNTRVNFKFDQDKFIASRKPVMDNDIKIVRTDGEVFQNMPGSVVPAYFWETEEDFLTKGVGFSLYYKNKLSSTAYSSCINASQLELGIETVPEFRGKGFAQYVCQALIDYCIEHQFEPVWACRLENTGSYKLAKKVGFVPTIELPYYQFGN